MICSVFQLLKMFRYVLDRPLIRNQLRPHLIRLVEMVLMELDQVELLFYTQRDLSELMCRFSPTAAAGLCWTHELRLRAEDTLNSYRTVERL